MMSCFPHLYQDISKLLSLPLGTNVCTQLKNKTHLIKKKKFKNSTSRSLKKVLIFLISIHVLHTTDFFPAARLQKSNTNQFNTKR